MDGLENLIDTKFVNIRREVYWGLSNIAAASDKEIDILINHKIFLKVLNKYDNETL